MAERPGSAGLAGQTAAPREGCRVRKSDVLEMLRDMPDEIEPEELMYRLYLKQKLEAGETALREGRVIPHDEVVRRTAQWFR